MSYRYLWQRISCAALLSLAANSWSLDVEQFIDPIDGHPDMSQYLSENAFGFLPIPIVITEPAVGAGLGVAGLFFHETDEEAAARKQAMSGENAGKHLLPPSVSATAAAYTGNGSTFLGAGHMGFFDQGRIRYRGAAGVADVTVDYYSLGGVELPKPVGIKTEALAVFQTLKFQVQDKPIFVGLIQRYLDADLSLDGDVLDDQPDSPTGILLQELNDLATREITTSGLGVGVELDLRDNVFTPTDGYYYDLSYVAYRDAIASDIDYDWYRFSGLNYWPLAKQWRLGVRFDSEAVDSDQRLPPFARPGLDMRGIPAARYQGTHMALLESELTWQLTYRWSVLAFAGAGRVSEALDEIREADNQVMRGAGFRYNVTRQYGFHMGIDIARGPEETVWYIQAGSAW